VTGAGALVVGDVAPSVVADGIGGVLAAARGAVAGAIAGGLVSSGVLAAGRGAAESSVTALAMPIEATKPSIVEMPMPAVVMRARCAACRRGRRRGDA